jgi:hypothetical protein
MLFCRTRRETVLKRLSEALRGALFHRSRWSGIDEELLDAISGFDALIGLRMVVARLGLMATTSPDEPASVADTDAAQRSQYAENLQQP